MIQLNFINARVRDSGYGLEVNGKSLEEMISVALGVKSGVERYSNGERTGKIFDSRLCNVSVSIDDRQGDITETISFLDEPGHGENDEVVFEDYLEEIKNGNIKKIQEEDPEE